MYCFVCVCVCVSAGRASVGPHVEQSDGTSGWLHSQADERLPHCAAWRQPIHTGTVGSPVPCPNIVPCSPEKHGARVLLMDSLTSRFLFFSQELLKTVVFRTRRTLDEDIFLPLYPKKYVLRLQSVSSSLNPYDPLMKSVLLFRQCVGEQE